MTMYRVGPAGIPASLKTNMDAVLNKKFGTSTTYAPATWPDNVNLLGPLPEKTASGAIASFSDGADDVPIASGLFSFVPSQAGSGTPSPSNPRAISGYSGMTIYHTGKNLLSVTPTHRTTSNNPSFADCMFVKAGTYIFSFDKITNGTTDASNWRFVVTVFYSNGTIDDTNKPNTNLGYNNYLKAWLNGANLSSKTLTLTFAHDSYIFIGFAYGDTTNTMSMIQPMLETGSTATTYEAYKSKTPLSVSFGSTVYGGNFNADGTLTTEWEYIASYNGESITEPWISSIDDYVPNTSPSTGAEVAYKLATPTTTTLSALGINTYYGANNIYTDVGESSIDYRADIALALNQ